MKTVFITGANRGLGLEFARQLNAMGYRTLAGCRNPHNAIQLKRTIKSENIIHLDTGDPQSIKAAVVNVRQRIDQLSILINNAGIGYESDMSINTVEYEKMLETFKVNTIGPLLIAKEFEPLLSRGSIVINISSLMGSISDNKSGGGYSYRISKAALNMVSKNLSIDWADKGIIILNMHPGWVRTDMGGTNAPLSKKISVGGMIDVIKKVKELDSGKFINYDGVELPW